MTTDPDLTEAVEAAARALYDGEAVRYRERNHGEEPPPFDAASPLHRHSMREAVLPLVAAAAPYLSPVPTTQGGTITIRAPRVPFPGASTDADFMRSAARNLEGGYKLGGSNLTATVVALLRDVATALEAASPAPTGEAGRG